MGCIVLPVRMSSVVLKGLQLHGFYTLIKSVILNVCTRSPKTKTMMGGLGFVACILYLSYFITDRKSILNGT